VKGGFAAVIAKRTGFFYGWVIVGVAFCAAGISLGVRLAFPVFFVALTHQFGWDRAGAAATYSISMIVVALTAPLGGHILDRIGARWFFLAGAGLFAAGLIASGHIGSLFQWYLAYGVLASVGITALSVGAHAAVLSRWFVQKRGTAIGLAFAGTGLGTFLMAPLAERLITMYGWRAAYGILALILLGTIAPLNFFLMQSEPADLGLYPDGLSFPPEIRNGPRGNNAAAGWTWGQAVRTWRFWVLLLAAALALFALRMITVHQVAYLVDIGYSRLKAATVAGMVGAVTAVAFVAWGYLSDRVGRRVAYLLGSLCLGAAILVLLSLQKLASPWLLYAYPLFSGLGEGSRSSLITASASDTFPGPHFGAINGSISAAFAIGAALGPWLAGYVYDQVGAYNDAFLLAIAATAVSALCIWVV